jgi:hypothetical protein
VFLFDPVNGTHEQPPLTNPNGSTNLDIAAILVLFQRDQEESAN